MRRTDTTRLAYLGKHLPVGERAVIFLGVLIAHGALLVLWQPHPRQGSEDDLSSMVMLSSVVDRNVAPYRDELRVQLQIPDYGALPIPAPATLDSSDQGGNAPHLPAIDWDAQAVLSIATHIATQKEQARQSSALVARVPSSVVALPPVADLGSSWAGPVPPRRVETLPEGGMLIRLGERCVLVFNPLPFVACSFGSKK